jgi:hypothetical protein
VRRGIARSLAPSARLSFDQTSENEFLCVREDCENKIKYTIFSGAVQPAVAAATGFLQHFLVM